MVGSKFVSGLVALCTAVSGVHAAVATTAKRQDVPVPAQIADHLYSSSWPGFATATARWSNYMSPTFNQVFFPESEEELTVGLQYFTQNDIPFLAKSGGHGYSITLHSVQDAVLVNMINFNYSRVHPDGSVTIGAGATFNDLVQAAASVGREVNVGSCPCVGATGAMLGGGIGRLMGLHGLTIDSVQRIRMATWNGTIVEASATENPDLFWGLRGAGHNFGFVIETTYETYPASNGGIMYQADMTFNVSRAGEMVATINSLLPLDPALALIGFGAPNQTTLETIVFLNLVYAGPESKGREYADRFAQIRNTVTESLIPWKDLPNLSASGYITAQCTTGTRHDMYGVVVNTLDPDSFQELFEDLGNFTRTHGPKARGVGFLIETFALQAIKARPDDFNAFPHRGTFNNFIEFDGSYKVEDSEIAEAADAWVKKWRDHFAQPEISGYERRVVYANYGHGDEPLKAYYGYDTWRQERLTALKNKYDPHGVFDGYHAVPRSMSGWD